MTSDDPNGPDTPNAPDDPDDPDAPDLDVRQARLADREPIVAFTSDTWGDRFDGGDYLPRVFDEWVESDGPDQRTFVAELDGAVVGVCQCAMLSEHEAWAQGMRVHPDHRGRGVAVALNEACFEWARERGATVCRAMVFSWNVAGLGAARGVGFDPCTEFRWAHPEPDLAAEATDGPDGDWRITDDPDVAWSFWRRSDARDHLRGLALDPDESWALSELTRERFHWAADESAAFAVQDESGTCGAAFRVRDSERDVSEGSDGEGDTDGRVEIERRVEYGVGAWEDAAAARALFAAIANDAADLGADRTRVLIPETPRHVSDVAFVGASVSEEPDFVLEADLTGTGAE